MEVTWMELLALLVSAIAVPYIVALIRNQSITGRKAQWLAYGVSVLAGIASGFVGGIPATAGAWVTCIFAAIGGVQVAYTAFKGVGVTCKWLEALMEIGTTKPSTDNPPKIGGTDD